MPKKRKPSDEEIAAFHQAVLGVKPLKQSKVRIDRSSYHKKIPIPPSPPDLEEFSFTENSVLAPVSGEEFITFKQADVSNKTLRKLRKGQYNVEAILDLHGQSVDEAKIHVENFLSECLQAGIRTVLIIHGKGHHSGMPILKNKLNVWLRETQFVLAFCSAAPSHGSRGALYVLLKKHRGD